MAAPGGRDRGQHRRRLPAVQQVVQLLLLGPRSMSPMRSFLLDALRKGKATITPPAPGADGARGSRPRARRARPPAARPLACHPRGRCRFVQRLRARDPCRQQSGLRRRAVRPEVRGLAAPCRRAAGHRTGHLEHARGAAAHLQRGAGAQMGRGAGRLRHQLRRLRRLPCRGRTAVRNPAGRPARAGMSAGTARDRQGVCWP